MSSQAELLVTADLSRLTQLRDLVLLSGVEVEVAHTCRLPPSLARLNLQRASALPSQVRLACTWSVCRVAPDMQRLPRCLECMTVNKCIRRAGRDVAQCEAAFPPGARWAHPCAPMHTPNTYTCVPTEPPTHAPTRCSC